MKKDTSRKNKPESYTTPDRFYPPGKISIGDPRLSAMARRPDTAERKRKSQIGARIFIITCVVLSLAVIVAVLLPMMLGKEPGVPDTPPDQSPDLPPEEPDDKPDLPPDEPDPPTDEPIDPPVDEPDPPAEEWVTGRLEFKVQTFLPAYTNQFGTAPKFDYLLSFTYEDPTPVLEQCASILLEHYCLDKQKVSFPHAVKYRTIVQAFLIDAALEVRLETPFDEKATVQQTLTAVSRAAHRLIPLLADNGEGLAIIPESVLSDLQRKIDIVSEERKAFFQSQSTLWAMGTKEDVEASLGGMCQNTARALMVLLHGYTPPPSFDNPQEDPTLSPYDEQMLQRMDQLAVRLRELLGKVSRYSYVWENEMTVGFCPIKFHQIVMENFPALVEEFCGVTYEQFLMQVANGKLATVGDDLYIFGRTDFYATNCVVGNPRIIDFNRLGELVRPLEFEKVEAEDIQEMDLTCSADVVFFHAHLFFIPEWDVFGSWKKFSYPSNILPLSLFTAGHDAHGNYYLRSGNYVALLTESQYDEFIDICSKDTWGS